MKHYSTNHNQSSRLSREETPRGEVYLSLLGVRSKATAPVPMQRARIREATSTPQATAVLGRSWSRSMRVRLR